MANTLWGIHTKDDFLFLNSSVIAIGWKEFGDLKAVEPTREAFKEHYESVFSNAKKGSIGTGAGMLYRFCYEMQIGDYVVYPSKTDRQINLGVVESDYMYVPDAAEYVQQRKVKWLKHLPRTAFSQGALYEVGSAMSLFAIKTYTEEYMAALDKNFKKNAIIADDADDETVAATADDIIETTKDFVLKELSKLNKHYYDLTGDTISHMYIVGSVGRQTAIKGSSDLDILFDLPQETFKKFDGYSSNGQSALLQEVKGVIQERYPKTDISGDGQVVVIEFDKYTVELVPGFKNADDSFKYPDTHDGGSWKTTNPIPEQNECKNCDDASNGIFFDFCHILRNWKNAVGVSMGGLLIDTLVYDHFSEKENYSKSGYGDYLSILTNVFEYLKNQKKDREFWYAVGSKQKVYNSDNGAFVSKAKAAYDRLNGTTNDTEGINDTVLSAISNDLSIMSFPNIHYYWPE